MELSLKDLSELLRERVLGCSHSFVMGEAYLIRTVTHYYTGRVVAITDSDLVLGEAAWIASTGRFADALRTGKLEEVEPFGDEPVFINRGAIVDATRWCHSLPRTQQ